MEDNNKVEKVKSVEAEDMNKVWICDYAERGPVIPEVIEAGECSTKVQIGNGLLNACRRNLTKETLILIGIYETAFLKTVW